jgi:hypothetical protein
MKTIRITGFLAFLVLLAATTAFAEVSLQPHRSNLFIKSANGGIWAPVRHGAPAHYLLNPGGDVRGDIFGDWARNPVSGFPEVVWSRNQGGHFDVVFSWWNGLGWQGPARVSASPENDLRPFLYHDANGTRYVVWTGYETDDRSSAWIAASFDGEADFGPPSKMHADPVSGLLPAAWVGEYSLLAVYEERRGDDRFLEILEYTLLERYLRSSAMDNPILLGEIILEEQPSSLQPTGSGSAGGPSTGVGRPEGEPSSPASSAFLPSDPRIHMAAGVIWVDWIQTEHYLGYAAYEGAGFGQPEFVRYHGPPDLVRARRQVRRLVLGPPGHR